MAELKDRIRQDLREAMKAKEKVRTSTLRMLLAAVQTEEVSGSEQRDLSDAEIVKVVAKESKKRSESAQTYDDAGRGELADTERAERAILDEYLPAQLDDDELAALVDRVVADVRAEVGEDLTMKHMGQVMKEATARADGGVDGKRLSAAVKERLG